MKLGTLIRDNRLLGALALALLIAAFEIAHLQGGVSLELGDLMLSVKSHQDEGLILSFVRAP